MRLSSLLAGGEPFLGARREDGYVDLNAEDPSLPRHMGALLRSGLDVARLERLTREAKTVIPKSAVRFRPTVTDPGKVLCLGLNFVDHATESAHERPTYPVVFSRYPSSFVGHDEGIVSPIVSDCLDYEAELVVVIGERCWRVPRENALDHVAGYTLMNDGSLRDYQVRTHQWMIGKNFDRSGALGPELVTADELPPGARGLALTGRLDGRVMQRASTSDMVFDVATTIATLSEVMTLDPGDLVAMGTPAGVGFARRPPIFMKPGNVFEVEVEGVGVLRNPIVAEAKKEKR